MDVAVPVLVLTNQDVIQQSALGIIRSLGRLGVPVYTTAMHRVAPTAVSRYLTGSFALEIGDWNDCAVVDRLTRIGEELGRPAILISTNDSAAAFVAEHSDQLKKWFLFPQAPQELPRQLANKKNLHSICRSIGLPCPEAAFPRSIDDVRTYIQCGQFPVILKTYEAQMRPQVVRSVNIVRSAEELVNLYQSSREAGYCDLMIQEYIPEEYSEDWIVHGYVNPGTGCFLIFTGKKLRSYPPFAGSTTLGVSINNEPLSRLASLLLRSVSYAGIVDLDYRLDKRDGQYKLLDFNPRIGANFRIFENQDGVDVVRALHLDLTGKVVRRIPQVEGRVFIVDPHDLFASFGYMHGGKLTPRSWWRSLKGRREPAWFSWDDPAPFLVMCLFLLFRKLERIIEWGRAWLKSARLQPSGGGRSPTALKRFW